MHEREEREEKQRLLEGLARVLADLPGDPPADMIMYRCETHGLIPPEDVTWFPDLQPHCPFCNALLKRVSSGEG